MQIEKIDKNKLEVIINIDDLSKNNISLHSFMSDSAEKQKLIFEILSFASNEIGFSIKNCEIVVEAFSIPLKNSFVLIITRIPKEPSSRQFSLCCETGKKYKLLTTITSRFHNFENFCMFCNSVSEYLNLNSSLFFLNNNYYLLVKFNKIRYIRPIVSFLTEFADDIFLNKNLNELSQVIVKHKAIEICKKYCI